MKKGPIIEKHGYQINVGVALGALYEDSEVVIDRNLVSSWSPTDLHAFGREMITICNHLHKN